MGRFLAVLLGLLVAAGGARGHDFGVSSVQLAETAIGRYSLTIAIHPSLADLIGTPVLPDRCGFAGDPRARAGTDDLTFNFECRDGSLRFDEHLVLPWKREGVLFTARWLDDASEKRFFPAHGGRIVIDLGELSAGSGAMVDTAWRYAALGVEHILLGIDHLLFVLALLLIVRDAWTLLKTITAFTVAHSITLALATLGLASVPSAPVEAAIALSIVFVAAEGLRAGPASLTVRYPWLAAFAFGLLHGFGFAGALAELSLPAREVPLALLCFNIGVELGQILFVGVVLVVRHALRRLPGRRPAWVSAIPGYAIGTIAMLWLMERLDGIALG